MSNKNHLTKYYQTKPAKNKLVRYLLQAINYTVFMALIWYFATTPSIRVMEDDEAVVTMAFGHAGETIEPCRQISAEELAKLPPNMRKPQDCPRERSPISIELLVDGEVRYSKTMLPPGLFDDGGINIYVSEKISAGEHTIEIKMDDSVRKEGFDYVLKQQVLINPAKILLIGFDSGRGFVISS